jgi:perosamine synthetase
MHPPEAIPLFRVHMPPEAELMPALEATLYSGYVGQGPKVAKFEDALAGVLQNPNILTVNSGTSAIQLALRLAGVRGGEVITTPMTCVATNMPVLAEGAEPVWADIDPVTGNIDPDDVARKVTWETKAILAVHWGGQPCDLDALNEIGDEYGIPIIEDAAHALGARWDGKPIGAGTADYTCFSLQAIKHITTVDGGVLATRDSGDCERGKLLRWYGIDRDTPRQDDRIEGDIRSWGYKFHMNDVTATIGLAQLPYLPSLISAHQANAAFYDQVFAGHVERAGELGKAHGAWWLYTLLLPDASERDLFAKHMTAAGITVSRVHGRNDTHTCFAAWPAPPLPGVDEFASRMCCIPVHWALTSGERQRVADAVLDFCDRR